MVVKEALQTNATTLGKRIAAILDVAGKMKPVLERLTVAGILVIKKKVVQQVVIG